MRGSIAVTIAVNECLRFSRCHILEVAGVGRAKKGMGIGFSIVSKMQNKRSQLSS